jgi:hypothetical protein
MDPVGHRAQAAVVTHVEQQRDLQNTKV